MTIYIYIYVHVKTKRTPCVRKTRLIMGTIQMHPQFCYHFLLYVGCCVGGGVVVGMWSCVLGAWNLLVCVCVCVFACSCVLFVFVPFKTQFLMTQHPVYRTANCVFGEAIPISAVIHGGFRERIDTTCLALHFTFCSNAIFSTTCSISDTTF